MAILRGTKMKITKRQIRRIIREEKARLNELGIDRMTSGDRDPRLEDPDDLTIGLEVAEEMVEHLQAINDLVTSERGRRSLPAYMDSKKDVTAEKFQSLLQWAEDNLAYWSMNQ
tara:strand:- start:728 stop:1069 length:342 start_codon:yes stop_codon:yes gene_type:complete